MTSFVPVPPGGGWVFEVYPGDGSDSGLFGLCLYQRRYFHDGTDFDIPPPNGWGLRGTCTTQYAADHGWDNFLRCHKRILSLLRFWQELGVTVEVDDEGRYTGSEKDLRDTLGRYHRLIAVCAGASKDAAETVGSGLRVDAPVFKRPDFERLEHEGWQEIKADPATHLTGSRGKDRQR